MRATVYSDFFHSRVSPCRYLQNREQLKRCGYNGEVKIVLRDYRREDFDTLWNIDQKCFAPGIAYSRIELATYIRRRGSFTIVAEAVGEDGRPGSRYALPVVGFLVAEHDRRGVGHIISIDVLPANRRSGVGSKLILAAEERLCAISCHAVMLETAVDNAAALAFYKRQGYSVVKVSPRYYSNGVDAFVLQKDLL
jgi:[ribosomal protein S18]-alanine N-acetyltransferase